jgi:glycosyltransferase involved in cell wall biosynthesis
MSTEMKKPLVSAAVITYNQKELLKDCIESILSQDYPNFEIVVADDGSLDGTKELLLEYQEKYGEEKFKLVIAEKNQGITPNSNAAHFACNGKYISWIGGDDLMLPGKLSKQVEYMESNPDCTICYHNVEVFDSDTGKTLKYWNSKNNKSSYIEGTVEVSLKHGVFNCACTNMVRRSKTPKHGYETRLPIASDWMYWIETLENGGTINYIDEVLAKYRVHSKNITKNPRMIQEGFTYTAILTARYPQYAKYFLQNAAKTYREMSKIRPEYYREYLKLAIFFSQKFHYKLKYGYPLLLNYLSGGRVKK